MAARDYSGGGRQPPPSPHSTTTTTAEGHRIFSEGLPSNLPCLTRETAHQQPVNARTISKRGTKVYYGISKDPDLVPLAQALETDSDDEQQQTEKGKSHRRKLRRDFFIRKSKGDINAPPANRMPFPPPTERDRLLKLDHMRDMLKAVTLGGGPNGAQLPSVVCSTLFGEADQLSCVEFSDDCELLAAAYQDARIRLWPTSTNQLLYKMHQPEDLPPNPDTLDNAIELAFDATTGVDCQLLSCHGACAMSCKFSPDRRLLLAGCDDGVIRLYNLLTYELTCQYRGHSAAIWSIDSNPNGFYFASAGHGRSTRLWNTETISSLRIFAEPDGEDITCIKFHPSGQYIATGCWHPAVVRLYDCSAPSSGGQHQAVRQFYGHNSPIKCLTFSRDGRYIVSADEASCIWIWDIGEPAAPVAHLCVRRQHQTGVEALYAGISHVEFSHDNNVFVAADLNCMLHIWDAKSLFEQCSAESSVKNENKDAADVTSTNTKQPQQTKAFSWAQRYLLKTLYTKKTPVFTAKFSRRNVLWIAGPYVVEIPGETVAGTVGGGVGNGPMSIGATAPPPAFSHQSRLPVAAVSMQHGLGLPLKQQQQLPSTMNNHTGV